MAARRRDLRLVKQVSTRIQRYIDDEWGTFYRFEKQLKKLRKGALASTVRGWLPPQVSWKAKDVSAGEWAQVRFPDTATLMELCDLFQIRMDYFLFGLEPVFRGQGREPNKLEEDLEAFIWRQVESSAPEGAALRARDEGVIRVNARAILLDLARWVEDDAVGLAWRNLIRGNRPALGNNPVFRRIDNEMRGKRFGGIPTSRSYYLANAKGRKGFFLSV